MGSEYLEPGWVELFKSQVDNTEEIGPREVMKPGKSLSKGTILKLGEDKNYKIEIAHFLNPAPRDSRYRWMLTTYKVDETGRSLDGKEIIFELIYNRSTERVTLKEFDPEKEQRKQAWQGEHGDDDLVTESSMGGGGYIFNDRENNSDIVHNIKKKKRKSKKKRKTKRRKSKRKKHKTRRRKS